MGIGVISSGRECEKSYFDGVPLKVHKITEPLDLRFQDLKRAHMYLIFVGLLCCLDLLNQIIEY